MKNYRFHSYSKGMFIFISTLFAITVLAICGAIAFCLSSDEIGAPVTVMTGLFSLMLALPVYGSFAKAVRQFRSIVMMTQDEITLYRGHKFEKAFAWNQITAYGAASFQLWDVRIFFCTASKEEIWQYWREHRGISETVGGKFYDNLMQTTEGQWQLAVGTYLSKGSLSSKEDNLIVIEEGTPGA